MFHAVSTTLAKLPNAFILIVLKKKKNLDDRKYKSTLPNNNFM